MKKLTQKLIQASNYSLQGLKTTWRNEYAFRIEIVCSIILFPIALWLGNSLLEKALLIASLLLVIMVELINSAIESTVNRVSLEKHPLSKNAKDQSSAAVFIAVCIGVMIWGSILFN
jgi:diacylglycerol kinase (ATP)